MTVSTHRHERTALTDEQRAVLDLTDALCTRHLTVSDDPSAIADARALLARQGLWVLDAAEDDVLPTALLVVSRIARTWPALALAAAHALAAVEVVKHEAGSGQLLSDVLAGNPVAVIDGAGSGTDLRADDATSGVHGNIARVDVAGDTWLIVVNPPGAEGTAVVVAPAEIRYGPRLRTTGLAGAGTRGASLSSARPSAVVRPTCPDRPLILLRLAVAAAMAGTAEGAHLAALEHARTRQQFGGPLIDLPTIRTALATSARDLHSAFAAITTASEVPNTVGAAQTLSACAEAALRVTDAAVGLHGGYGYLVENKVEANLRDVVSLRAAADVRAAERAAARFLHEGSTA